jgi:ectoine hydroxylase-related dioxygenase (phytanoyl-CoA dioxygenase family)
MAGVLGAVELLMRAGDVLLFVDCLTHGAARRTNPGVRRTIWHRYSMAWSRLRWGYTVSPELVSENGFGTVVIGTLCASKLAVYVNGLEPRDGDGGIFSRRQSVGVAGPGGPTPN